MLLKIVLLKTFLLMVNSKELLENNTVIVNESTVEKLENITKSVTLNENINKNFTIETERIIKPMTSVQLQSQTEQVSKIVNSSQDKPVKEKSAFKASPQLDIQYEYNKFPVVPAFPEAKHFSSLISGNEGNFNSLPWVEKQPKATEEPPWLSRVRFPTAGPPLQQLEHPYPFYNGNSDQIAPPPKLIKPPDSSSSDAQEIRPPVSENTYRESNHKPSFGFLSDLMNWDKPRNDKPDIITTSQKHGDAPSGYGVSNSDSFHVPSSGGSWEKYTPIIYKEKPKTKPNLSILDKPISPIEYSPWKKIIKFLTAAIPIGLLISALTPSVITIEDTNTTSRARAENNIESKRILQSLRGIQFSSENICEERVLCELLVNSGSSKNAEQYVENLLETFVNKKDHVTEHIKQLKEILNAVKNGNCALLKCKKTTIENT